MIAVQFIKVKSQFCEILKLWKMQIVLRAYDIYHIMYIYMHYVVCIIMQVTC